MQYTLVVGSLCVLAVVAFIVSFLRDIHLRPLSEAEAMRPLKALAEGKAFTGHILLSASGGNDTEVITYDGAVWQMTFIIFEPNYLRLVHAEAPDSRYTPRDTFILVDDPRAVKILKDAWETAEQWQEDEYVTA